MQTLTRRGVRDAVAGVGLHFLHMSEGPFSMSLAGHMVLARNKKVDILSTDSGFL